LPVTFLGLSKNHQQHLVKLWMQPAPGRLSIVETGQLWLVVAASYRWLLSCRRHVHSQCCLTMTAAVVTMTVVLRCGREMTLPIALYLGVPKDHVFANRMNWQWDDDTGEHSSGISAMHKLLISIVVCWYLNLYGHHVYNVPQHRLPRAARLTATTDNDTCLGEEDSVE
jgi:hypothetical protein